MSNENSVKEKVPWNCDKPYKYPIPRPPGDLWEQCLEPLTREDRIKCDAWKEEIQNVLIFAGLFSAVVTAFTIESYQSLQPTQNDTTSVLLIQIHFAMLLQNSANVTGKILPPIVTQENFLPSHTSIRVNTFWFLSLVLSLATVLIGIIITQWLREYQRYLVIQTTKHKFAQRNLRHEGLEGWWVPHILSGLPLLLQAALVLFFTGLIEFLWALPGGDVVAIPVIVVVAMTLFFLLATTVLPALQCLWLSNDINQSDIPNQCPYKSPQSLVFLQMIRKFSVILRALTFVIFLSPPAETLRCFVGTNVTDWFYSLLPDPLNVKHIWGTASNWSDFDDFWMYKRALNATENPREKPEQKILQTDYDAARGIACLLKQHGHRHEVALRIYHCFQELLPNSIHDHIFSLMTTEPLSWSDRLDPTMRIQPMIRSPSPSAIRDENGLFLLHRLPQTSDAWDPLLNIFKQHQLELFVRTCTNTFANPIWSGMKPGQLRSNVVINAVSHTRNWPISLLIPRTFLKELFTKLPKDFLYELQEQICMIINKYLSNALATEGNTRTAFHPEELVADLFGLMPRVTTSVMEDESIIMTDMKFLLSTLTRRILEDAQGNRRLLSLAMIYASCYSYDNWSVMVQENTNLAITLTKLLEVLYQCELRGHRVEFFRQQHVHRHRWNGLVKAVLFASPSAPQGSYMEIVRHPSFLLDDEGEDLSCAKTFWRGIIACLRQSSEFSGRPRQHTEGTSSSGDVMHQSVLVGEV